MMRRVCLFYIKRSTKILSCIYNLVPPTRNSFRHPKTFKIFPCWTEYLKMLSSYALLMNEINLILMFEVVALDVYFVTLHWILLVLLNGCFCRSVKFILTRGVATNWSELFLQRLPGVERSNFEILVEE